ncbi:hypothetical protein TNIN_121931 [Trichonephila inaurata madagascariensis]|uniref:Uncharacterized protein n=1 Tax=Trichonephila inaurata madagascariensis TaxID=2747483 RepID=A0A8X6WPT5_9ARAC|nr:hypothetical protein TNIN_121931 [Trichonephila inaurata madagascariensis]
MGYDGVKERGGVHPEPKPKRKTVVNETKPKVEEGMQHVCVTDHFTSVLSYGSTRYPGTKRGKQEMNKIVKDCMATSWAI